MLDPPDRAPVVLGGLPRRSHLLLIGAGARNVGKTHLACRIISQVATQGEVVAAKITVSDGAGTCPHGGQGCGACAEPGDGYLIVSDDGRQACKDTAQMKAAGATRAFWIRTRRSRLADAFAALLGRVGPRCPIVCESTSLRAHVVPAVFLLVVRRGERSHKPSAVRLARHADRVVLADEQDGDFRLEDLDFDRSGGRWRLRHRATAIVMAGGESTRMGRHKSLLRLAGQTALERICRQLAPYFAETLVSGGLPDGHPLVAARVVPDREAGRGPLMGLACALAESRHDRSFVRACDIPDMDPDLVGEMLREARHADLVIPCTPQGRPEPLFAVYRKRTLPAIEHALAAGESRISAIFPTCKIRWLSLGELVIPNLNTPSDLAAYRYRLRQEAHLRLDSRPFRP